MKTKILRIVLGFFALVILLVPLLDAGSVRVKGYFRKDGTYVQPHYRSSPNSTVRDNWSYKDNINPYTGKEGTNYYRNAPTSEYYNSSPSLKSPIINTPSNTNAIYSIPKANTTASPQNNSKTSANFIFFLPEQVAETSKDKNDDPFSKLFSSEPVKIKTTAPHSDTFKIQEMFK